MQTPTAAHREIYPISAELYDDLKKTFEVYKVPEGSNADKIATEMVKYLGEYEHGSADSEDLVFSDKPERSMKNVLLDFFQYLVAEDG